MTDYAHTRHLIDAATPEQIARMLRSLVVSNPEVRRYVEMTLAPEPVIREWQDLDAMPYDEATKASIWNAYFEYDPIGDDE